MGTPEADATKKRRRDEPSSLSEEGVSTPVSNKEAKRSKAEQAAEKALADAVAEVEQTEAALAVDRESGPSDMMGSKDLKRLKKLIRRLPPSKQQAILDRASKGGSVDVVMAEFGGGIEGGGVGEGGVADAGPINGDDISKKEQKRLEKEQKKAEKERKFQERQARRLQRLADEAEMEKESGGGIKGGEGAENPEEGGCKPIPGTSGRDNFEEAATLRQTLFGEGDVAAIARVKEQQQQMQMQQQQQQEGVDTTAVATPSGDAEQPAQQQKEGEKDEASTAPTPATAPATASVDHVITKSKTQLKKEERERRWREKMAERGLTVPDNVVPSNQSSNNGLSAPTTVTQPSSTAPTDPSAAKATPVAMGDSRGVDATGKRFNFRFNVAAAAAESEADFKVARLMALDAGKDGFVPRRIWITGMPHEYSEGVVKEYWGYCGEIERCDLLTFHDSGRFNGTCFITFKTEQAYQTALGCNGELLEGRTLRIEKCRAATENSKSRFRNQLLKDGGGGGKGGGGGMFAAPPEPVKTPGYNVAYVGNLPYDATVEEIKAFFADCNCSFVRLHTAQQGKDGDSSERRKGAGGGTSKGYAHIHFADEEGLDKAIAMNGKSFKDRELRVSYAQPKRGASEDKTEKEE
eukprot:CAMPEP_0175074940 /NCGR_PEP_ID=MMETSP0052_2-20121109/21653_1 /TAXON_ID=51329 ORGANISM="Polytomella parva, Strain SAG 63-3" /NCGR_SAMPLE_ID=MMETSP0052_2 /ASSEMBLY_ACC=CAM_ASM_000194 /LENGTH=635 /DNA_ID=CAMNT_0016343429 /DNA_START=224 /DNA_END=2131 /DNA_ORIENTATION=+